MAEPFQQQAKASDEGSTFSIRLPRSAAPSGDAIDLGLVEPVRSPGLSKSLNVLIVEDNLDAAKVLQLLLRTGGHAVTICHDGLSAVDACGR